MEKITDKSLKRVAWTRNCKREITAKRVQMLKSLISQLSKECSLEPEMVQTGGFKLQFEHLGVMATEGPEAIVISAHIGELPEQKSEEAALLLMSANLFGKETGAGMLGLDRDGKKVLFVELLPPSIDYKHFHGALEGFLNYAESWQEELKSVHEEKEK